MKKSEIRKEFLKLKNKGHSYNQCKSIIKAKYGYETTTRTLKRWIKRFDTENWDLNDTSKRPHTTHPKVSQELKKEIINLRKKTGWGEDKLTLYFPVSHTTINTILNQSNLCRESKSKGKRKKWVRWQRHHPNSLWQIDHTSDRSIPL